MSKKKELLSILNPSIINKKYNEYNIKLINQIDLINITFQSNNSFNIFNQILIYNIYIHLNYLFQKILNKYMN